MSSHHFVRENQEPALIIANGESCAAELLGQLLEWSPYVVVLDGAIFRVRELGIRFDALLGDFDGIHNISALTADYAPVEIVHAPDQNKTDLQKAIEWLSERGHKAANIVWATGRRADHTYNNLATLPAYADRMDLVIWDDYSRVYTLKPSFKKWYPAGFNISLLPVNRVEGITTTNLHYNLHNESLELPHRSGSSNASVEEGFVTIEHKSGQLLLMECFDKPVLG
jgi:thiamine pyrophosphokinase